MIISEDDIIFEGERELIKYSDVDIIMEELLREMKEKIIIECGIPYDLLNEKQKEKYHEICL